MSGALTPSQVRANVCVWNIWKLTRGTKSQEAWEEEKKWLQKWLHQEMTVGNGKT